ncbi:hypothetical protein B0H14DRAFT_2608470 [Mycena olivaceomarginata]|nr:hypothetical protein B0H14DRAFT_2608470 [Mycena olivaceomarginata]
MSSGPAGRSPHQRAPTQIYYCDCARYCKTWKPVKRATFFDHEPYRNPLGSLDEHASGLGQLIEGHVGYADRVSAQSPPPKKRRLASPTQSDSDESESGLATMLLSDDPPSFVVGLRPKFGLRLT